MKTIYSKFVTVFLLVVMVFNQYGSAYALPGNAQLSDAQPKVQTDAAQPTNAPDIQQELDNNQVTQKLYNQPAKPKPTKIKIELVANPGFIIGNVAQIVTINWLIIGAIPSGVSAILQISFPKGYSPIVVSPSTYDALTQTLSIPVTTTSGEIKVNAQTPVENAAFSAILLNDTQTLAQEMLSLPMHESFNAKKSATDAGALISAEKGRIKVRFGKNSLPEDATINIGTPAGDTAPEYSLSGHPFEINAQGVTSKKELHQFAEEVAIDVDYSTMNLHGKNEYDLRVYYYDPQTKNWSELPTQVDKKTKTLHAITTHFSIFDSGINDWSASHLPTLDSFQVSNFTGSATYSMPIEVPAGPGGLQPNLTLSYNSQVIDQSTASTQASWVGMGWSLGTSSIELNDRGTNEGNVQNGWTSDDTWFLNINGVGTTIVATVNGEYRALDESDFMKFTFIPDDGDLDHADGDDSWTVQDKSGNTYFFEKTIKRVFNSAAHCQAVTATYQWMLTRIRNIFGKELSYTYDEAETRDIAVEEWSSSLDKCRNTGSATIVTAIYPATITYPDGHYRVRFQLEGRLDFTGRNSFQQRRLNMIVIEQDENLDNAWNIIRKYDFEYASDDPNQWNIDSATHTGMLAPVWPGITSPYGGKTTTLIKVHQFGKGGTTELPTATFTYGDSMHLTSADNGYGGTISFTYGIWYYTANAPKSQTYETSFDNINCDAGSAGGFQGGDSQCAYYGANDVHALKMRSLAINTGYLSTDEIRPGGAYKFSARVSGDTGSDITVDYGLSDGLQYNYTNAESVVVLPATASRADVLLRATQDPAGPPWQYAIFRNLNVQLLTSIYRVTARTISDGSHSNLYTYDYKNSGGVDTAAVNDTWHSGSSCPDSTLDAEPYPTCHHVSEKYGEFRGNGQVTELAPNGLKTVTTFNQDDYLRGRPNTVTILDTTDPTTSDKKLTQQVTSYVVQGMPTFTAPLTGYLPQCNCMAFPYAGILINWVATVSVENRIYNSAGSSYEATKTSYVYDGATCGDAQNNNCTYSETGVAYGNGNLKEKIESSKNGSGWLEERTTHTDYIPNIVDGLHLTGLPARQWVTKNDVVFSHTLNVYDNNTTWNVAPTVGKLAAVRTWINGADYSQVSYLYDLWGNRTDISVYNSYGTSDTAPTTAAITQKTDFDPIYHTYPVTLKTPPIGAYTNGFITTFTYDYTLGLPLTQTDPNGVVTEVRYDSFGRMLKLFKNGDSEALPTLQVVYYDTRKPFVIELKQKINDTQNYFIRHTYDGIGRETATETGNGGWDAAFSAFNKVLRNYTLHYTQESAPYDPDTENPVYTTTYTDVLGRPDRVVAPGGAVTLADYTYNGLITSVKDAKDHTTTSQTDVWGRTISVTPPITVAGAAPLTVSYEYNPLNQLTKATRAGLDTTITYDKAGRKTSMDDPDMGSWYYKYDALGNLIAQVDANQYPTNLYYDALNRLIGKTFGTAKVWGPSYTPPADPGTYTTRHYYDQGGKPAFALGRRTRMDDVSGRTSWIYDERGRITSETKTIAGQTFVTGTTYNSADMPLTTSYPDGEVVTNSYNARMLLNNVQGDNIYINSTSYDSVGRVGTRILGNGTRSTYEYYGWGNQGGRLKSLKSGTAASPTSLQNLTYTYDDLGNIETIKDSINAQTQFFVYDQMNRLLSAKACTVDADNACTNPLTGTGQGGTPEGLYSNVYGYDAATGNLAIKAGLTLNYDDANHPHAVTSTSNGNSYGYDKNGNQIQRVVNGETYTLTYDTEGHLTSIENITVHPPTSTPTKTATKTPTAIPPVNPGVASLVSWWSMDEASGNRNDSHGSTVLTPINAPGTIAGIKGNAVSVNSSSGQVVRSTDNANISMNGTTFTISGWIRISALPTTSQIVVTKMGGGTLWSEYGINLNTNGKLSFVVSPDGTTTTGVATTQSLQFNAWNHFVAVYDGTKIGIYLNGNNPDAQTYTSNVNDGDNLLQIGTYGTDITQSIDEVVFWKRALTPAEVNWLYNNGAGRSYNEVNPVTPTATVTATASLTKTTTPTPTACICTNTPIPTITLTPTITPTTFIPVKNWNFDTTVDGWTANAHTSGFVWQAGGYVGASIINTDPQIYSANNLNQDITSSKLLKIRYKNTTSATTAQIFFITNADTTWGAGKVVTFTAAANSNYTDYTLDMSTVAGWTGTLKQLRFDPAGASGSFSLDYIRVANDYSPIKNWNFDTTAENWTGNAHTSGFAWQTDGSIGATITGTDPAISLSNLNQDITSNKLLKIRYKNSTAGTTAQIFFMTDDDTTWVAGKTKIFTVAANSDYTEYTLDSSA